jgi:2-iminobutanoate/2-iminopropanoate deaminase
MMHNANLIGSIVAGVALVTVIGTASTAKECYAPDSLAQRRAFSRAVTTEGGKAIWLGGQTGAPNLDFEGQVRQIFSELDKNIKAVGGRGLEEDMVTMTVFITDVRNGDRLTDIRKEIFKECFPSVGGRGLEEDTAKTSEADQHHLAARRLSTDGRRERPRVPSDATSPKEQASAPATIYLHHFSAHSSTERGLSLM